MLAYLILFWGNGRQYREVLNEVYVRDPDDLGVPAAVAGYVDRFYEPRPDDLAATAIDLVARGVIGLHDDTGVRVSRSLLSLRRERATRLWPHEVAALALLLAPCGRICPFASFEVLHRLAWRDRRVYDDRLAEFGGSVAEEVYDLGLTIEPYGVVAAQTATAVAVAVLVLGGIASGLTQSWVYEVAGLAFTLFVYGFDRMWYRRTRPGRILQLRCAHLRRYWHDFGRLGEKHVDDVELWGRHLAFAVALGDATLARRELHDPGERLVRLVDSLTAASPAPDELVDDDPADDDPRPYVVPDDVDDARIDEWLETLDLPESALVGMDG